MATKRKKTSPAARPHIESPSDARICIPICIALAAIVVIAFSPAFGAQFVNYDDDDYVYGNPEITNGLSVHGIKWAFTHFHASNWHPLTTISHMLDCQLYGLQPLGHHLTNVLLHALGTVLLFLALRKLTLSTWPSAFVAAFFAVHPLRVESVAWISERKDVLSGVFFALTLWTYAGYVRSDRRRLLSYAAVIVSFVLGLLCKPTLVTVPFVLLLLDYWPLKRWRGARSRERGINRDKQRARDSTSHLSAVASAKEEQLNISTSVGGLVVEKVPLFLLSAASCVVTISGQQGALVMNTALGFGERVTNALVSYVVYLKQTVYPTDLAAAYPYPQGQVSVGIGILAGVVPFAITLLFLFLRKRYPFLIVGWLWFLGTLVPMIGIVQVGAQPHADRYTYLAQIGLFLAVAWMVAALIKKFRAQRVVIWAGAGVVIFALGFQTYAQSRLWHDSESLWKHAMAVTTDNYVAYNNLGDIQMDRGQLDEAISYYEKAVNLRPSYAEAQSNLGNALLRQGRTDEAMAHLEKALQFAQGFNNMGSAYMQKRQVAEAITYYEKAVQIDPNYAEAQNNLGVALLQSGRADEAIAHYRKAVAIKPDSAELQCNLGNALTTKNDWTDAIAAYHAAIHARPDYVKAHNNLGVTFEMVGNNDEALVEFGRAVQINRDYAEAQFNFGRLSAKLGHREDGIAHLTEALRLRSDYPEAKKILDSLNAATSH